MARINRAWLVAVNCEQMRVDPEVKELLEVCAGGVCDALRRGSMKVWTAS